LIAFLLSLKIFATNPPNTVLLTNDCSECAATLDQVTRKPLNTWQQRTVLIKATNLSLDIPFYITLTIWISTQAAKDRKGFSNISETAFN
jgi:hypothetical protein